MKISVLMLLCFTIFAMCTDEEEIRSHKRIARQATTKKATTTTKKPATTTTKKATTTTKKPATTTKKVATTTKKAATTTTKKATTTTKKAATTTTKKAGVTSKTSTTEFEFKIEPVSLWGGDFDPVLWAFIQSLEANTTSNDNELDEDETTTQVPSTTMQTVSTTTELSNSRPTYRHSWNYYSFQRWFNRRYFYVPRKSQRFFNFMSRPWHYMYFRRN